MPEHTNIEATPVYVSVRFMQDGGGLSEKAYTYKSVDAAPITYGDIVMKPGSIMVVFDVRHDCPDPSINYKALTGVIVPHAGVMYIERGNLTVLEKN